MKLDELKKMIKEELDTFIQNENMENLPEVDVDETSQSCFNVSESSLPLTSI